MRTAVDLKLFEKLQEAADTSVSIEKLAAATGADATLLGGFFLLSHALAAHSIQPCVRRAHQDDTAA